MYFTNIDVNFKTLYIINMYLLANFLIKNELFKPLITTAPIAGSVIKAPEKTCCGFVQNCLYECRHFT